MSSAIKEARTLLETLLNERRTAVAVAIGGSTSAKARDKLIELQTLVVCADAILADETRRREEMLQRKKDQSETAPSPAP